MNKRKVLSILLLALITVTLAVSCSGNIDTPAANSEELSYVTFGNGHSRELGTSYTTEDYGDLFWFYTARKNDQYGTTGVTTAETPVSKDDNDAPAKGLSGRVGPFSQGAWNFTLYAYKEANKSTLVYKSDIVSVTLKGGEVKNVPVSVTTQGATGYVRLNNVTFNWNNGGGTDAPTGKLVFKGSNPSNNFTISDFFVAGTTSAFVLNGPIPYKDNTFNIPADFYTVTATAYLNGTATDGTNINNEGTPLFSQTFGLRVYGNATTVISGDIIEGVDSKVTFDVPEQEMVIFTVDEDGSRELTVPITPDGEQESNTVVSFPSGALDTSAVHQLNVTVTPIASAEQNFQVSGIEQQDNISRTAVAGIDLTMVKVQKNTDGSTQEVPVTSFGKDSNNNDRQVTITTYIATGLSSVEVKYLDGNTLTGDGISNVVYTSSNGQLTFTTTHFSQYVVVSPVEALNVNTGVPYTSLATAIADAKDGQEVKVMKDVDVNPTVVVDKGITINLNGKNITGNSVRTLHFTNGSSIITGTGTISSNVSDVGSSVIRIGCGTYSTWDATTSDINISLIIDRNVKITSETCYGITVMGASNETLEVKGEISSTAPENTDYDGCAVSTNGSDKTLSTIIIHEGAKLSALNTNAIYMPSGCLIVNGGEITGRTGIYIKSGPSEINGGTITGNGTAREYQTYGNGGISTGDAFVVDNTDYPNGTPSIIVNGGTFNSINAKAVKSYAKTNESTGVQLPIISNFIKGGRFSSDPTDYLANGHILGYHDSGYYEILPEGPERNSDETVWTVTPVNAQYTLDGAYGSIDGKTIVFSDGNYSEKLILGRPTKFEGSNTTTISTRKYSRTISNVTFTAKPGVKLPGFLTNAGDHVYGTSTNPIYDYVTDNGNWCKDTNYSYYTHCTLSNFTFNYLTFVGNTRIETSANDTVIDGFTFKNCTFNINNTASGNQAIRYYNENNNGNVKNLTVDNCTFNTCYQGVYTQKINGVTVRNSTFDTTAHNAIAIQSGSNAVNHKAVVITGNTFKNIGDRIIRFGNVGAETQITIQNNTATNSGDSAGQVIKAESLAEGITYNISGNNWGAGKTVANTQFQDTTSSQNQ